MTDGLVLTAIGVILMAVIGVLWGAVARRIIDLERRTSELEHAVTGYEAVKAELILRGVYGGD